MERIALYRIKTKLQNVGDQMIVKGKDKGLESW